MGAKFDADLYAKLSAKQGAELGAESIAKYRCRV